MNIKDFLENSYKLNKSIQSKKAVLDTIDKSLSVTTDKALVKSLKMEQAKLKASIDDDVRTQIKVIRLIQKVKDATLRSLLEYKYVCNMDIETIAEKLHFSPRHISRMNIKAVQEAEKYYKSA